MRRRRAVALLGLLALLIVFGRRVESTRIGRHLARTTTRWARYETGRLKGVGYRFAHGHPDPQAESNVLADRVRSVLGPLEHRLDVPRVLVHAEGHRVVLHGDVDSTEHAKRIVDEVQRIAGVDSVDSHIHVGMFAGDTRPSEGVKHVASSPAMGELTKAAIRGGAPQGQEQSAVRGVLTTLMEQLPKGERRHVLGHLPADVRHLAGPLRPRGFRHRRIRRPDDFCTAALPMVAPQHRKLITCAVLASLRDLVPEESADVAAVLSAKLREMWREASTPEAS